MSQQIFTFVSQSGNTIKLSESELSKYGYLKTLINFKNCSGNGQFEKLENDIFDFIQKTYNSKAYPIPQKYMPIADYLDFNFWNEYYPKDYIDILNNEEELIDITNLEIKYVSNIVPSIFSHYYGTLLPSEISNNLLIFNIIVYLLNDFKFYIVIGRGFALTFFSKKYRTDDTDLFLYNCDESIATQILEILKHDFTFDGYLYELTSVEESKYAYTFHFQSFRNKIKIQLIKLIHKNKLEMITNFDLGICQVLLTLDSRIEATQKFIYSLNNQMVFIEFNKLTDDIENRACRYHRKGLNLFMPYFNYFKEHSKKDFSKHKVLKGQDILISYIYSPDNYVDSNYRYGETTDPHINNPNKTFVDQLSGEFLFGNCGRFGSYTIEDYSDWYLKYKYPELEIPIFNNSIVSYSNHQIVINNCYKKYSNVYRKFSIPCETKILDEKLFFSKMEIIKDIANIIFEIIKTEEYVAYGKFAYTLLEKIDNFSSKICTNLIRIKDGTTNINELLNNLCEKNNFKQINKGQYSKKYKVYWNSYKIEEEILFNVWTDEIIKTEQQILELKINDVENVILKSINNKIEFVTTDEILWSAKNKINTKNNFQPNYGNMLDKNFNLIKYQKNIVDEVEEDDELPLPINN